jgi:hypothetical protein
MTDDSDDPRLSALYRRVPRSEPDADSDRQILAAARRAVESRSRRLPLTAWALAATVVLGAGVSWRLLTPPAETARALPPEVEALSAGEPKAEARRARPAVPAPGAAAKAHEPLPVWRIIGIAEDAETAGDPGGQTGAPATADTGTAACGRYRLEDDAGEPEWHAAIARARAAGEQAAADCLAARYRQLFLRPAPDR